MTGNEADGGDGGDGCRDMVGWEDSAISGIELRRKARVLHLSRSVLRLVPWYLSFPKILINRTYLNLS